MSDAEEEEGAADAPAEHEDTAVIVRTDVALLYCRDDDSFACLAGEPYIRKNMWAWWRGHAFGGRPWPADGGAQPPADGAQPPASDAPPADGGAGAAVSASELARRVVAWSARHAWQGQPASLQEILCALIDTRALRPGDHFSDATLESALKALESDPATHFVRRPPPLKPPPIGSADGAKATYVDPRPRYLIRPREAFAQKLGTGAKRGYAWTPRGATPQVVRDREAARKLQEAAGAAPPAPPAAADVDVSEDAERGSVRWVVGEKPTVLRHGPEALRRHRDGWVRHVGDLYARPSARYVMYNQRTYTPVMEGKENDSFEYW